MFDMKMVRDNSSQILTERNIPLHPHLPVLDVDDLRSPEDVCKRIIALYSLAGLANGAAGDLLKSWLVDEGGWNYLTPEEQAKLENIDLSQEELNELSWMQESLYTLCWCGSIIEEMSWPSSEADLSYTFGHIPPETPFSDFFEAFQLRSFVDIIQHLDLYYCLHSAVRHPELLGNHQSTAQLKIEVILERRQALEWICSTKVGWNDVTLDT